MSAAHRQRSRAPLRALRFVALGAIIFGSAGKAFGVPPSVAGPPAAAFAAAAAAIPARVAGDPADGPRLLVVAGAHGDESSGTAAADILVSAEFPRRGSLALVPRASPGAVESGARNAPGEADFNRSYGRADGGRAALILELALACDLVLDLHEAGFAWPEADFPTLVISPAAAFLAMDLIDALGERGLAFAFTGGAPPGSLVGELGDRGRAAIAVEVPSRLPPEERVALHLAVVDEAMGLLGMSP